ncbi:polymer-forming cytoskeletal protein [Paenibacillus sediminis]|uniref:Cytoskeletal protein CcmA (Bactofilin family) n=1 Tax=Paenibacillus sediminis TaxID=664909 RepID=A0ABS4H270_9BACL|nr:polymer-forming cytoskeletal protein [Paenibacillus sediminis]MBP1936630.1 cytoskeletal protein CcmA (bactofilin family) [Paenibacillus sediminis]
MAQQQNARYDMHISGVGKAAGGQYGNMQIDGMGKVNGDIDCLACEVNGTSHFYGAVIAESIRISGTGTVDGEAKAGSILVEGFSTFKKDVSCKSIAVNGRGVLEGNLTAETVEIGGSAKIKGDLESETIRVQGGFSIGGFLNAGELDITLQHVSQAKDIGVEKITVKKGGRRRFFEQITPVLASRLEANVIEGDEIYLEYTHANTVRGNRVTIGPGCRIKLVEYKEEFKQDPSSQVKKAQQV